MNDRMLSRAYIVVLAALCSLPFVGIEPLRSEEALKTLVEGELIWSQSDGSRFEIYVSTLADSAWSNPQQLTNDDADNLHPSVDVSPGGEKWAVWTAFVRDGMEIRYCRNENGRWQQPAKLDTGLASNIKPSVLVDGEGTPMIVWTGNRGGSDLDDIYYSQYLGQAWTEPKRVNPANMVPDILPDIERGETGKPVVSWRQFRAERYVSLQSTWDGKQWSEPVELPEDRDADGGEAQENVIELPDFVNDARQAFFRLHIKEPIDNTSGIKRGGTDS